ncbi:response regulator [Parathalassolituus penaei]|uniref:Response regulator n=1 Tax=Parathalassolituus penaei TaxID=2997323 RepID=A0A9X3EAG2_9GAMM|nr:response regulator [Parathalassolituus penaei]MCY0963927.1 response regulator [Parathalassolituus penaei]
MDKTAACRVLLVDDHPLFRRGLAQLLEDSPHFTVVQELENGNHLLDALHSQQPQLLLLDLNMPQQSGLELLQLVRERQFPVRIVVITASEDDDDLFRALAMGADGFLMKDTAPAEMLESLQRAMTGKIALNPDSVDRLAQSLRETATTNSQNPALSSTGNHPTSALSPQPYTPDLTARERQTLLLIAQGLNNKLIARKLGISDGTVKVYVKSLLRKLDLHSRLELAAWVHKHPDATSLEL